MKTLVTGAAGFIGSRVAAALAQSGDEVTGVDNLNDYYDPRLKEARLAHFGEGWRFLRLELGDKDAVERLFGESRFDRVVHLAAQAGVRYSITHPWSYIESNIIAYMALLEAARKHPLAHLVYASSSSVYGMSRSVPFSEADPCNTPVSLYAATKKSDELMAHAYAKLYGIPLTGLRYFTVYGPWGRPDMSPFLFASAIEKGEPIKLFNHGDMLRDFTYIDDIVEGTLRVLATPPQATGDVPARVYNIGRGQTTRLLDFVAAIERDMGREARKELLPMQPGDVYRTFCDTTLLERDHGYRPKVDMEEGVRRFVEWYKSPLNPLR